MTEWRGTKESRTLDMGVGPIFFHLTGVTAEHMISEIRRVQALYPGMRISGNAMMIVADPDQLELFEAEDRSER